MNVQITRLPHAMDLPLPEYETPGAVGFDFTSARDTQIDAGAIGLVPTGLVIKTPENYALVVVPRSSTPLKKNLDMPHSIGIIDKDYCGPDDEIFIQVRNFSSESVTVQRGDKIAQGLFVRVDIAEWNERESEKINEDSRGGFGSTGGHA